MTTLATVTAGAGADTVVNQNLYAVSPAGLYGRKAPTTAGLTFGYYGGFFGGNVVPDGTISLPASEAAVYVVADRATGTVSESTSTTDWNDSTNYFRIGLAVTGASTITTWEDHREAYAAPVSSGGGAVDSVNGQTGAVLLALDDLDDVDAAAPDDGDVLTWDDGAGEWVAAPSSSSGIVESVVAGTGVSVDNTDPANPVVSATGGSGMTNPMTTDGDLIVGGASGVPTRLGIGTDTHVLTLVSGAPAWAAPSGGSGSPAGSTTWVQYNNSGAFGAEADFAYDPATNTLDVPKVNTAKGADIARATTTDIGAATGNFLHLTGTTTVTGLGTVAAGATRTVRFAGAGTLTHNATSLILPGAASITTAANDCALFVSEGSGNWRCIAYSRANGTALVTSGSASLTNFTGSLNTASPNNTVNAARLLVTGGTTNVDFVIQPKGTGAILAQLPDSTTTGGNKRGIGSVDFQTVRDNANQVADGGNAFIGAGYGNKVSGQYAAAPAGYKNIVDGPQSMAGGLGSSTGSAASNAIAWGEVASATGDGAFSLGRNTVADSTYGMATGAYSTTRGVSGCKAHAANRKYFLGDTQTREFHLHANTTSASAVIATTSPGSAAAPSNQVNIPEDCAITFHAVVSAKRASSSDAKGWIVTGMAKNIGGTISIVGTPALTVVGADAGASAWTFTVVADSTNDCINFSCTGASGHDVAWTFFVRSSETVWT